MRTELPALGIAECRLRIRHFHSEFWLLNSLLSRRFSVLVLQSLLFMFLLFRVLRAYDVGDGAFASLVCGGVGSFIAFQLVANVGSQLPSCE